jgi:hypothetical protein
MLKSKRACTGLNLSPQPISPLLRVETIRIEREKPALQGRVFPLALYKKQILEYKEINENLLLVVST